MKCICGCGEDVKNKYVLGHQRKGVRVSEKTRELMSKNHIGVIRSVIDYGKPSKINHRFYNTKPERFLKSALVLNGIEHDSQKQIFGVPDIFIKPNICVFVDGCYWHGCNECGFSTKELRILKKHKRDLLVNKKLKSHGYKVIRIWEHEINNDLISCVNIVRGEIL